MSDRDRLLSYVKDNLKEIKHYIKYPHRRYQDLIELQSEIDALNLAINQRLNFEFGEIPEVAQYLGIEKEE